MRIALLSDIHGNRLALQAVLDDIAMQGGVDQYWILGDLAAIGADPEWVLQCLAALPNTRFIRGNTDRYVITGERPGPSPAEVQARPELQEIADTIEKSFTWTRQKVAAAGWLDWLQQLPLELRVVLPDGTRFLGVHASPGRDDGLGIYPTIPDEELDQLIQPADADLIAVGHTHWPVDRPINGRRVINLGSISNPFPPDLRSSYVFLEAGPQGYTVTHRRVDYDRAAAIERVRAVNHPAMEFIHNYLSGRNTPFWVTRQVGRGS